MNDRLGESHRANRFGIVMETKVPVGGTYAPVKKVGNRLCADAGRSERIRAGQCFRGSRIRDSRIRVPGCLTRQRHCLSPEVRPFSLSGSNHLLGLHLSFLSVHISLATVRPFQLAFLAF